MVECIFFLNKLQMKRTKMVIFNPDLCENDYFSFCHILAHCIKSMMTSLKGTMFSKVSGPTMLRILSNIQK